MKNINLLIPILFVVLFSCSNSDDIEEIKIGVPKSIRMDFSSGTITILNYNLIYNSNNQLIGLNIPERGESEELSYLGSKLDGLSLLDSGEEIQLEYDEQNRLSKIIFEFSSGIKDESHITYNGNQVISTNYADVENTNELKETITLAYQNGNVISIDNSRFPGELQLTYNSNVSKLNNIKGIDVLFHVFRTSVTRTRYHFNLRFLLSGRNEIIGTFDTGNENIQNTYTYVKNDDGYPEEIIVSNPITGGRLHTFYFTY